MRRLNLGPLTLLSTNVLMRSHWRRRAEHYRDVFYAIRAAIGPPPQKPPDRRVRVRIKVSKPGKPFDVDNLYGAVKPVIDALVRWRLLRDDSPEWLDLNVEQVRGRNSVIVEVG